MDTQNTSRQFRYLEEVRIPCTLQALEPCWREISCLSIEWHTLCRITGKGSVFYRRGRGHAPGRGRSVSRRVHRREKR